ncbi:MAG: prepilin-type N-terminal cleavage/methylation domain-containing protein [Planctomycetes bacterium]|nr:prepilin-type N-terminal cleavage/methylation domain-containing protein [Planctomycetota bacterium]
MGKMGAGLAGQPFLIMMKKIMHKSRKGFSLAEAMMATVLLSVVAAGVLVPYTTGAAVQVEGTRRTLAAKLGSDLVEKIVKTDFEEIVDEYGSYTELIGQVKGVSGEVLSEQDSEYANFSRDASCEYAWVPQENDAVLDVKFILAEVRVYYKGEELIILRRLISR